MPKPTDPSKQNFMFSDDMKFLQKVVIFHPADNSKILILKRAMNSYSRPGDWDFPGGNVLFGETHDVSVKREVKEETGLDLDDMHTIQVISRYNEVTKIYYLFINYYAQANTENIVLSDEHISYKWVSREEFEALRPVDFMLETARAAFTHFV